MLETLSDRSDVADASPVGAVWTSMQAGGWLPVRNNVIGGGVSRQPIGSHRSQGRAPNGALVEKPNSKPRGWTTDDERPRSFGRLPGESSQLAAPPGPSLARRLLCLAPWTLGLVSLGPPSLVGHPQP